MIDMILEYNTNPNKELLNRGIPSSFPDSYWGNRCNPVQYDLCPEGAVSDHRPYYVKVKIK
jgi:hypothetical protein